MCTASLQMAAIGMSPMLSSMAKAFPEASTQTIQFVMTLPALVVALMGFVFAFLSRRIPNNILAGIGGLLGVIAAVGACFFHPSIGVLCFWSVIIGMANGLAGNGQSNLVNKLFTKEEKPGVLGFQTFASSLAAMLMTFVGGILVDVEWNLGYLVYLIALPGMIGCFLFLPNITKPHPRTLENAGEEAKDPSSVQKSSTCLQVKDLILPILAAIVVNLIWNICTTNMSMFVEEESLGSASQAGTAMTVILIIGAVAGALFGLLFKKLGYKLIVVGFLLLFSGYMILFFIKAYWALILDCLLFGGAMATVMSCITMRIFEIGGEDTALAIALMGLGSCGGTLLAPLATGWSAGLFQSPLVKYRFLLGAILAAVSAVFTIAVLITKRQRMIRSAK